MVWGLARMSDEDGCGDWDKSPNQRVQETLVPSHGTSMIPERSSASSGTCEQSVCQMAQVGELDTLMWAEMR